MKSNHSHHDAAFDPIRSTIKLAGTLLGFYIATYLAVAGLAYALTSPEVAIATAPALPAFVDNASTATARFSDLGARDSRDQSTDRTDNSRECNLDVALDSMCVFN